MSGSKDWLSAARMVQAVEDLVREPKRLEQQRRIEEQKAVGRVRSADFLARILDVPVAPEKLGVVEGYGDNYTYTQDNWILGVSGAASERSYVYITLSRTDVPKRETLPNGFYWNLDPVSVVAGYFRDDLLNQYRLALADGIDEYRKEFAAETARLDQYRKDNPAAAAGDVEGGLAAAIRSYVHAAMTGREE